MPRDRKRLVRALEVYRLTGTPVGKRDTNVFLADWVE